MGTYQSLTGYSNPMNYGAVGDGIADDTDAIQGAIDASTHVYLPPNTTFKITSPLTKTGGLVINGNSSEIKTEGDLNTTGTIDITVPLKVDGQTVGAVSVVNTSNLPSLLGESNTFISRVTVSDASEFDRGDVVKIYSMDDIPQSDPAEDEHIGEFAVVVYVDEANEYLYLDTVLRHDYTTTPKISALGKDKVDISGLDFITSSSQVSTANTKGVIVRNAVSPKISDVSFTDFDDNGISYFGCYGARTRNITGYGLKTSSTDSATGYLVFDVSSSNGVHESINGSSMRSIYDCDAKASTVNDGQMYFGESVNNKVVNSSGIALGAHAGSRGLVLDNITIENAWKTPSTSIVRGFNLRGIEHRVYNSRIKAGGVLVSAESGASIGASVTFYNCEIDATPIDNGDTSLRAGVVRSIGHNGIRNSIKFRGGYVRGIYNVTLDLTYTDFEGYSTHIHCARNASSSSDTNMFIMDNSTVKNFDPIYDTGNHEGTGSLKLFKIEDDNCVFTSYNGVWINSDEGSPSDLGSLSNTDATVNITGLRADTVFTSGDVISAGDGADVTIDMQ